MTQRSLLPIELPMSRETVLVGSKFQVLCQLSMYPRNFEIIALDNLNASCSDGVEVYTSPVARLDIYIENRWIRKIT